MMGMRQNVEDYTNSEMYKMMMSSIKSEVAKQISQASGVTTINKTPSKSLEELRKEFEETFGVAYQLQKINDIEESVLVTTLDYFSVDKVFNFFLPYLKSIKVKMKG